MASPGGNPKKVDYPTPQEWYDYLNLEFGFTLDPCCAHGTAKCKKHYTEDEDGLSKSWADERVFMNPPYGRNIAPWMAKAYEESKRGALVVCFVPARVDTNWWHDYAIRGEVRLPKGRCKNADGSAWPFPIAIVIFRPHTYTPNTATVRTAEQIREACDCVEAVGVGLERKSPEQQAYRNGYLNSQHDIRKALLGEADKGGEP